jgi:hypothetical protein
VVLLGRVGRLAPLIVVHPCTHAAGELRWHRAERAYALRAERRGPHFLMRALMTLRTRLQPRELARASLVLGLSERFNALVHQDYGVPRERLRVVRTPVDLARFSPDGPEPKAAPRTLLSDPCTHQSSVPATAARASSIAPRTPARLPSPGATM